MCLLSQLLFSFLCARCWSCRSSPLWLDLTLRFTKSRIINSKKPTCWELWGIPLHYTGIWRVSGRHLVGRLNGWHQSGSHASCPWDRIDGNHLIWKPCLTLPVLARKHTRWKWHHCSSAADFLPFFWAPCVWPGFPFPQAASYTVGHTVATVLEGSFLLSSETVSSFFLVSLSF